MSAPKRVRWNCPNDKHPAVLASTRPPIDSIERYCLPCTQETGRLAKRVAPVLERKRAAAAVTSAAKAKAKRARDARARERKKAAETARYTVEGVDLRQEMKRLVKLRTWTFKGRTNRMITHPPELVVNRRSSPPRSQLGHATGWRNRIVMSTYPGQDIHDARETLVHELTHIAVGCHRGHDQLFRDTLRAAMKEAYKIGPAGLPGSVYHGRYAAALRRKDQGE